ncbi:MAG: hypothetical protein ACI9GH_000464 [Candidatus Paceibacteria bacterium]|jgi:uncharacterized protein YuzE
MINITYDKAVDAKYISIKKGKIFKTKILKDWLNLDFNKKGDVLGVEILNASKNPVFIRRELKKYIEIPLEVREIAGTI